MAFHLAIANSFDIHESPDTSDLVQSTDIASTRFFSQHHCKSVAVFSNETIEIDGILKRIQRSFKATIKSDITKQQQRGRCNHFILDTVQSLMKVEDGIILKKFKFSGNYFLTFLRRQSSEELQVAFEALWQKQIYNLYAVFKDFNDEVLLMTFDPFADAANCGKAKPSVINKFEKTGRFLKPLEFKTKFMNLNGCVLRAQSFEDNIAVFKKKHANGSTTIEGHEMKLVEALSTALNFKVELVLNEGYDKYGMVYENGTATGTFKELLTARSDINFGDLYLKARRIKFFDSSISYLNYPVFFVIPRGEKLTPMEKLLAPFSSTVWYFITATIAIAILIILIINYRFPKLKPFVYGKNINNPVMNVIKAVLGLQQCRLPKQNFARFLLMMFLIFCLILRSIYQGSLYQFLQSDGRHLEPRTIAELLKKNFKFVMTDAWLDLLEAQPQLLKARKDIDHRVSSTSQMHVKLQDSSRNAYMSSRFYIMSLCRDNKTFPYKVVDENLLSISVVIYYRKDFYLKEAIDSKIRYILPSGIIEKWISENDYTKFWKRRKSKTPTVLTMDHLSGIFYVLAMGHITAIFIFCIEVYTSTRKIFA